MTILYVLISLFCFNFIIFFHELFHLLAAKILNIKAVEFAVGMGKSIVRYQKRSGKHVWGFFSKKNDERFDEDSISYHIRLLPIGGYVLFAKQIESDEPLKKSPLEEKFPRLFKSGADGKNYILEDYLSQQKPIKRIIVAAAGPVGNFILAFLFALVLFIPHMNGNDLKIVDIVPNSYAEKLGLDKGDVLLSVNDKKVSSIDDFSDKIQNKDRLCIAWERNTKAMNDCLSISESNERTVFGIYTEQSVSLLNIIPKSIQFIFETTVTYVKAFVDTILNLNLKDISGPVGTIDVMQQNVPKYHSFVMILIFINIALGVANLIFPTSITDGGRIFLDLLAIIFKKHKINSTVLDVFSFTFLLFIMIYATYQDIIKIFFN